MRILPRCSATLNSGPRLTRRGEFACPKCYRSRRANYANSKAKGFTLIELLIVIGMMTILFTATITIYGNWQNSTILHTTAVTVKEGLELAKARSNSGYDNTSHGVYFNINEGEDDEFIIYQGSDYLNRAADYDLRAEINNNLAISTSFIGDEINFSQGLGRPSASGIIVLTDSNTGEVKNIFINSLGIINVN